MMRKNKANSKRVAAGVIAFIIITVMVLSVVIPFVSPIFAKSIESSSNASIIISGEMGFSGKYKVEKSAPFKIHLENNGDSFKGELQIKINVAQEPDTFRYNIFAYPVELPKGGSKVVEMDAILTTINPSYEVVLVDEKEKVVASEKLKCTAVDPNSVLAGIMTDNINDVSYIRQFTLSSYSPDGIKSLSDKLINLNETTFPSTKASLDSFNMLIINDFDTSRLSDEQIQALDEWVRGGGYLVIGTGVNFNKVFKGIPESIVTVSENGVVTLPDIPGLKSEKNISVQGQTPLTISSLNVQNGKVSLKEGEEALSYNVKNELGNITVLAFDLGQKPIPDLNSKQPYFLESEFSALIKVAANGMYGGRYGYEDYTYLAGNLPSLNNSTIIIIFIILFIYAIIIGPFLYLILKKKDIREKGFVILPIIAITTTIGIYLLSFSGMYKKPIINSVSKVNLEKDSTVGTLSATTGVFSPSKGPVAISFDKNIPIGIPMSNMYGYWYGGYRSSVSKSTNVLKLLYSEQPTLTYYDKAYWDNSFFTTNTSVDLKGTLDCKFNFEGKQLVGTITNNTPYDLHDIIVGYRTILNKYPELKSGQTIKVRQSAGLEEMDNGAYYDPYMRMNTLFFGKDGEFDPTDPYKNLSTNERRDAQLKQNIFQSFSNFEGSYYGKPMAYVMPQQTFSSSNGSADYNTYTLSNTESIDVSVYAFCSNNLLDSKATVNGKEPNTFNTSLLITSAPVDLSNLKEFDLPYGAISPSELISNIGLDIQYGNQVYPHTEGSIQINYTLFEGAKLESFGFNNISVNGVSFEIYNVRLGSWETLNSKDYDSNAMNYLGTDNKIKLRFNAFPSNFTMLPQLKVKGTK